MKNSAPFARAALWLAAPLLCALSLNASAGTLSWVHSFAATDSNTGVAPEGNEPVSGVTQGTDGNFYGLAYGGANKTSVVYRVTPGGAFAVIYNSTNDSLSSLLDPSTPLVAVHNDTSGKMVFYHAGGGGSDSNLIKITTDGTAAGTSATTIYQFTSPASGVSVRGGLLYDGDDENGKQILYGAAYGGGTRDRGTLFRILTDGTPGGTTVTILHNFGSNADPQDGYPWTTLAKGSDGNLYGTTTDSANPFLGQTQVDNGKVFQFSPSTGVYNVVYTFPLNGPTTPSSLVESSPGIFFGTARSPSGPGIIFKLAVSGTSATYTSVYTFSGAVNVPAEHVPLLLDADGLMYGVLDLGGANGSGEIFSFNPDGTVMALYDFTKLGPGQTNADGWNPSGVLALDADGNLYGTATSGGAYANGTVYRLNAPPKPPLPPFTSFNAQAPSTDGGPMHFTATTSANVKVVVQFSTDGTNWRPMLDGGVMTEQPAGSGNYVLDSAAYPAGSVSFRAVATRPGSARSISGSKGPFTLHMKPGLSATGFTVNESSTPQAGLADSALRFAARQSGAPTHLLVAVQASTDNATWSNLADNNGGQMGYDPGTTQFVLNSTSYPAGASVWFRAKATGAGLDPSISNVVGPFALSSNATHVAPPRLYFTGNGHVADFDFKAKYPSAQSGVTVRVQVSNTPADESSWIAFDSAGFGTMTQTSEPTIYRYLQNRSSYPDGSNVFFRVIAEKSDFQATVSGRSMPMGPFILTSAVPAKATLHVSGSSGGTGTADDPLVLRGNTLALNTDVILGAGRTLAALAVELNGDALPQLSQGTVNVPIPGLGDHVLQARVVDDLGVVARATGALFIRVLPPLTGSKSAQAELSSAATEANSSGKAYVAVKDGDFNDSSVWQDEAGHPGVPGFADAAFVGAHTLNSRGALHIVDSLSINGGTLVGEVDANPATVVEGVAPQTKCTLLGSVTVKGHFVLQSRALLELDNVTDLKFVPGANGLTGSIQSYGRCNIHGSSGVSGIAGFENHGALNFLAPLDAPSLQTAAAVPFAGLRVIPNVTSDGQIKTAEIARSATDGSTIVRVRAAGIIGENGSGIIGENGSGVISNDGGTLIGQDGNGLIGQDGNGLIGQDGNGLIGQDGNGIVAQGGGNVVGSGGGVSGGPAFAGRAAEAGASNASVAATLTGGELDLDGVTVIGSLILNGGVLSGNGAIYGDLINNSGYITPGHSAGHVSVTGNFTQAEGGTLVVENGGFFPSRFDALLVGGTATLGGKLDLKTINGYNPGTGDNFFPLSYAAVTGAFNAVSANASVTVNDTGLFVSDDVTKPQAASGRPQNVSTRLRVLTNDKILIGGFIITGPSGSTKKVLIRGLGPSLTSSGVQGVLPDPYLELHLPDGSTNTNDDWAQAPRKDEIPTGFSPTNPKEAVIVADLAPGAYTVLESAPPPSTQVGVGLVEVYELDSSTSVTLANISTRGFVDRGDNAMIGGFIIGGSEPAQILVRATGPSLKQPPSNLTGVLEDPTLELVDSNGNSVVNDNWRATQEAAILATGVAPQNDLEPAILVNLVPGAYTAIVRGRNDTTGIAVVEAYKIK